MSKKKLATSKQKLIDECIQIPGLLSVLVSCESDIIIYLLEKHPDIGKRYIFRLVGYQNKNLVNLLWKCDISTSQFLSYILTIIGCRGSSKQILSEIKDMVLYDNLVNQRELFEIGISLGLLKESDLNTILKYIKIFWGNCKDILEKSLHNFINEQLYQYEYEDLDITQRYLKDNFNDESPIINQLLLLHELHGQQDKEYASLNGNFSLTNSGNIGIGVHHSSTSLHITDDDTDILRVGKEDLYYAGMPGILVGGFLKNPVNFELTKRTLSDDSFLTLLLLLPEELAYDLVINDSLLTMQLTHRIYKKRDK